MIITLEDIRRLSAHPVGYNQAADETRADAARQEEALILRLPEGSQADPNLRLWIEFADRVYIGDTMLKDGGTTVDDCEMADELEAACEGIPVLGRE